MILKARSGNNGQRAPIPSISMRCPSCRQIGTLDRINNQQYDVEINGNDQVYVCGQRLCPNLQCRSHIFFVWDGKTDKIAASYPSERLDFDSTNIPAPIAKALEEAITCQANECFIASAIMVRKTLEELCQDRQSGGANLKERLRNLGTKIIIPQELLNGLDDLRLLGNDAAHVESQTFDGVGEKEIEISIKFTKEVLKAVFQYSDLLDELRSLKRPISSIP